MDNDSYNRRHVARCLKKRNDANRSLAAMEHLVALLPKLLDLAKWD
ncbi:MAG: hypothetical protein JSV38_00465 [Desulfobacterales bacterium]|nr:MAG: hypothetical protein JSV38_00465 [Desulfobacterales bacterium]